MKKFDWYETCPKCGYFDDYTCYYSEEFEVINVKCMKCYYNFQRLPMDSVKE